MLDRVIASLLLAASMTVAATAQTRPPSADPDKQARALEQQLTPDERTTLVHGIIPLAIFSGGKKLPPDAITAAGYVAGVPRLNIPPLWETDASLGVAYMLGMRNDGATPLPSSLATASTWDPALAYQGGAMIAQEAFRKGFNVLLAGGANVARDPRNGRNFEYLGEDPLLTGTLAGEAVRGIQAQHVISTVKHFAVNDLETGRMIHSAKIGEAAARESDLLAFEIAIERGRPGAVMCAYNRVNGDYACENDVLLNHVLKDDWKYPGWVMSDWGAVHSLDSALRGLDQQSGSQLDKQVFFDAPLKAAAAKDSIYAARLADMDRRILRSMIAVGAIDNRPVKADIDYAADAQVAKTVAQRGIVLLRNRGDLLPLAKTAKRIAVIGGHADGGVLSGGGSSQVAPPGGPSVRVPMGGEGMEAILRVAMYHPGAPLAAIRAKAAPGVQVSFDNGDYPSEAARLARDSDVAIVFVTQWMTEGADVPDLSLPHGQDDLVAAVAAANPRTIVVLETGGPVLMPWLDKVGGVLQAWYPGARGGEAIADILFGDVNPSGRLPISFPASVDQLPRPAITGWGLNEAGLTSASATTTFDVDYDIEGPDIGYRWYARQRLKPMFPFGYGLSYTAFAYSGLTVTGGQTLTATFTVTNTGQRPGIDTPQLYLTARGGKAKARLLGWSKVDLKPGESATVTVAADPRLLADWDSAAHGWRIDAGRYDVAVGASSADGALTGGAMVRARRMAP